MIIPNIWENKKCSKPPTRWVIGIFGDIHTLLEFWCICPALTRNVTTVTTSIVFTGQRYSHTELVHETQQLKLQFWMACMQIVSGTDWGGLLLGLPQNSSCLSSIGTCQILENRTLSKQTQQNHLLKNKNPSCGVDISVCVNNIASLYVGNQLYCKFMKAMVGHPKNIQSQAPRYSPSLVSLCLAIDLGKKGAPFINRLGFYGR